MEADEPEDALITRPDHEVVVRHLGPGGAVFLTRLQAGDTLGAAVLVALEEAPTFDIPTNIAGMLEAGVFRQTIDGELL
jgi:hypothetical protein